MAGKSREDVGGGSRTLSPYRGGRTQPGEGVGGGRWPVGPWSPESGVPASLGPGTGDTTYKPSRQFRTRQCGVSLEPWCCGNSFLLLWDPGSLPHLAHFLSGSHLPSAHSSVLPQRVSAATLSHSPSPFSFYSFPSVFLQPQYLLKARKYQKSMLCFI